MKGYMEYVAGLSAFMVVFTLIMVSGLSTTVGPDKLESYNISEEDLQFSPDLPSVISTDIDLENDLQDSENISVVDISEVNNTDFTTEKVVVVDNGSSSGYVLYRIDGSTEVLETKATSTGFFESSKLEMEEYATPDSTDSPIDTVKLDGFQTWVLAEDTNYVKINLLTSDARLYELVQKTNPEQGYFETLAAYGDSTSKAIGSWFTIFSGLPSSLFWLGSFFLILATVIVVEVIWL